MAAGINWVDTAALYGNGVSEQVIGEWLGTIPSQDRPHISTKFNVDATAGDVAGQIERSVSDSLKRLGLDRVSVLILHSRIVDASGRARDQRSLTPDEVLRSGGIADVMDRLRQQRLCSFVGLTGLGEAQPLAQIIDSGRFDVVQAYYNLLNPTAAAGAGPGWNSTDFDGLLQRCAAQDMGIMNIRIFAAGYLATTERHGRELAITANAERTAEEARARAALAVLGSQYGTSAQAALRFGLACPLISTIVVGIGEPWHLEEALKAHDMGPLPRSATEALEAMWRTHPTFRS